MVIANLCTQFFVFFGLFFEINAATHWIVTENGMIQSHVGSPLELRRPYDLIALLDQEKRWNDIQTVYHDLISRKTLMESKWSSIGGDSGIVSKMTLKENDCLIDGKLFNNNDLYSNIATNGSDRFKIELRVEERENDNINNIIYQIPDCSQHSKIEFSMRDYEHFPSLHSDNNVTLLPEQSLEKLMPVKSIKIFGHEIEKQLIKNNTSWVHYNLAALYWRIKGNGPKAVDCSRRALYYVDLNYRDIPLHNLAGILHQGKRSKEAALMLHSAIEYAPKQALHYLALGYVYLALGDYNSSIKFYDKFLELKPNHQEVIAIKNVTMCFSKVQTHLIDYQENVLGFLQGILSDLHDFHSQQQLWLRLNERLMWEHASFDMQLENFHAEALDAIIGNNKKNQYCMKKLSSPDNNNDDKKGGDSAATKKPKISCDFVDNPISEMDRLNLQNLFNYVESETQRINEHLAKTGGNTNNNNNNNKELSEKNGEERKKKFDEIVEGKIQKQQQPVLYPKFPTTISTSGNEYFDKTGWPSEDECKKWNLPINEKEDLKLPVFLPPENKGFEINKILSELIDLPEDVEHKLPWYPPNCDDPNVSGEKYIQPNDRQVINNKLISNKFLKNHLLKYVNNGKVTTSEAEIGQRIITAMDKKIAPNWVLATLASLYWRIRGNTKKSLDCLDLAFQTVPKEQTDVILISISSIINELGFINHALKFANLAFKLNYVEPSTNFLLGLLYYQNNNPLHAIYYMKNVIRVDKNYYNGHAEHLLKLWSCRIKIGNYEQKKIHSHHNHNNKKEEICLKSGSNNDCQQSASIQCYRTKNFEDGIGVVDSANQEKKKAIPGENKVTGGTPSLGDFYVSVALNDEPIPKAMLQIYDKSGTYPLSPQKCKDLLETDNNYYSILWKKLLTRNIDITSYLKGFTGINPTNMKPFCIEGKSASSTSNLDHLTAMILRKKLPNSSEDNLDELLNLIAGYYNKKTSIKEIGGKIGLALKENTTSWILANAAAIYWRIVGNAEEAINCLRLSLNNVPDDMKDLPLNNLANILQRVGLHTDALEVAYIALKSHPNFVVNHYTVGNIFTSMGDLEEAITFYRSSLALDSNFEPARNRLQTILCTLLFDDTGSLRNIDN